MSGLQHWLLRTHILMGLLLLIFGAITTIVPTVMSVYGIALEEPSARTAIRSIIGGGEIALGLSLVFGRRAGASHLALNAFAALVFGCVGAVRLSSAAVEGILSLSSQPFREGMIELGLAVLCLVAARSSSRP